LDFGEKIDAGVTSWLLIVSGLRKVDFGPKNTGDGATELISVSLTLRTLFQIFEQGSSLQKFLAVEISEVNGGRGCR